MDGTQVKAADYTKLGSTTVGLPGSDWHIVGAADYDGNGKSDLLWRTDSGALAVWEMNGTRITFADYVKIESANVAARAAIGTSSSTTTTSFRRRRRCRLLSLN